MSSNRIVVRDGPVEMEIGPELMDAVQEMLTTAQKIVVQEFQQAAERTLAKAKESWPERTGTSLRAFRVTTRLSTKYADVVIENPTPYAYKVKFSKYTKAEIDAIDNEKIRKHMRKIHGHGAPSGRLTTRGAFATIVRPPLRRQESNAVHAIQLALNRVK